MLLPPASMLPSDGRFGCGPSLIRPEQIKRVTSASELGTSHRKPPVKNRIESVRRGLSELFSLPDGFEVTLGNGGATAFWSIAACSLAESKVRAATFGEFGAKAAADLRAAPWLDVKTTHAPPGQLAKVRQNGKATADLYVYPQNETSTGVTSSLYRGADGDAITMVDATSIAGAGPVDWDQVDVYYFSPQKVLGSEGGLWIAVLSPAAQERARQIETERQRERYIPSFLSLTKALNNSMSNQTLNTPSISTLILLDEQIQWLLNQGGLSTSNAKARSGANLISDWASTSDYATMFVTDPLLRSPVVSTVDLAPNVLATNVAKHLRNAGILDIDGYRKLGRNQLRIASFPSIKTSDIAALLECIDWTVQHMQ